MFLQNKTLLNRLNILFSYHGFNLTENLNLTFSFHFEMQPIDFNLSYLFIYKFDHQPYWNNNDGWILFPRSSKKNNLNMKIYIFII